MKIEKKTWPDYFQAILDGKKNFDVRLADFEVKEGDVLVLKEWNPKTGEYTGREIERKVIYVLKTKDVDFWDKAKVEEKGLQVIGLK